MSFRRGRALQETRFGFFQLRQIAYKLGERRLIECPCDVES